MVITLTGRMTDDPIGGVCSNRMLVIGGEGVSGHRDWLLQLSVLIVMRDWLMLMTSFFVTCIYVDIWLLLKRLLMGGNVQLLWLELLVM